MSRAERCGHAVLRGRGRTLAVKTDPAPLCGLLRCGFCGIGITAEVKEKHQKNGNTHSYTYYRCTKRRGRCSQKYIEVKELEKQITKTLAGIEVPPEFHNWAMTWLRTENTRESNDRNTILNNLQKNYETCVRKLDTLIDMRASGEITEDEFNKKKTAVGQEKARLQELLNDTDKRIDSWLETADRVIKFASDAREAFTERGQLARKIILSALGSNLLLKGKKLEIDVQNALMPMMLVSSGAKIKTGTFEPVKTGTNKEKSGAFGSAHPIWLRGQDSNLQP